MPYVSPPGAGPVNITSLSLYDDHVGTLHPTYSKLAKMREKCRDVVSGQDTIKSKTTKYLPKLSGQDDEAYKNYVNRALFFSIGAKSLQAIVGMASLKRPKITAPPVMLESYFNFTENLTFVEQYVRMVSEVSLQNQSYAYVEWPKGGGDAYTVVLPAESVINWDFDENGEFSLVVIREDYYKKVSKYRHEFVIRHRELCIENGVYVQNIFENNVKIQTVKPIVLNQPLKKIPFIAFHSKGLGITDEPPLLLDIANINISHYMTSADLEHGRHFTGLPTPIITGATTDSKLYIGSNQFIVLPDKNANAKYLEFTGQGLASLEKALQEKQSMLASLSARLLDNSSKGSEATDAVKLRYLSETASLTTIVKTINVVLNMLYNIIAESLRESPKSVNIVLDTDFLGTQMSHSDMSALFDAYIAGAIDLDTLIYNLRVGQRLNPESTDDDVKAQIQKRKDEIAEAAKQSKPEPQSNNPKPNTSEK